MAQRIQFRRDTKANWQSNNPILLEGEIGYVTDDKYLYKMGDGTHHWNDLAWQGFNGNVVQEGGTSEDAVMSQKAVSEYVSVSQNTLSVGGNYAGEMSTTYDVTLHNSGATFASLESLLSDANLNTLIPLAVRKGGMSIKFVRTSDNKYLQYRLTTQNFSTNPVDWEDNTIISRTAIDEDFAIVDENGNAVVVFNDGEIETKKFQSINSPKSLNNEAVDDFIIADENHKAIVKFGNGGIETKDFNSAKTPNIEDSDSFDFALSDKNGKNIVIFKEGHIITKYFDSREITKKKLQNVKFSILGDSISTYQGYLVSDSVGYDGANYRAYYGNPEYSSPLGDVNLTWWKKLIKKSGMTLLQNCAWSGSRVAPSSSNPVDSTTNAAAGCSLRRIADLAFGGDVKPDIIVVAIGVNDMGQNVPLGTWDGNQVIPTPSNSLTFSESYALMLYRIMTTYPNAEIYCCTMLETSNPDGYDPGQDGFPVINAGGKSIMDFNNVIKSVALAVGARVIDTHSCGVTYWNISSMSVDGNQHPNAKGMDLICNCIYRELIIKSKFSNL